MGKPRITMADVAELAQVSKMSVSRTLNNRPGVAEETRQRIIEAVEQLHYNPAPNLRLHIGVSRVIALLIPDISTIYMVEILRGISNAAEQLNCGLMLFKQDLFEQMQRPFHHAAQFNRRLVDGVVMIVPHHYESIVDDLSAQNLPYVIVDHRGGMENEASVTATNRKGMLDATRYLLALGHRRIGFITGRMDIVCSHDRLRGYQDGLAEVGLPFDRRLVREGDFLQPSGFLHAQSLLQLDKPPTAIIASNDLMAFGAMEATRIAGLRIGHDVSIIGFDDIFLSSQTYPPLTTVRQPLEEMGGVALDTLVMLLEGRTSFSSQRELPTELIIRETTGRSLLI
jgi:LacI family transcriptional regulator